MSALYEGWADTRIADLYHAAERLSDALEDGSTEQGFILEAMKKIELADCRVEQRVRAAMRSTPIEDGRVTGSREPSRVSPSRPVGFDPARCENCGGQGGGYGWVCENHPDKGWPDQCECGAGMPCGACALQMASAGYVAREHERIVAWLKAIPESDSGWNPHDEQWDEGFDSAIRQVLAGVEKRVYAASADTHPEGGDAPENAAPSVMSGAVPKADAQTPSGIPKG